MSVRVLVADDQQLVREAVETILDVQPDLTVVASVGDGQAALDRCRRGDVDVAVLDVTMPVLDGIEASRRIRQASPTTRVLILTTFDDDTNLFAAVEAGARGFLTKDVASSDLVAAVRAVAAGHSVVSPRATAALLDSVTTQRRPTDPGVELSEREREVLTLLCRGATNADIAAALFLAETTVKTHLGSMLRKVGVRDRTQLVVWAYQHGLPD